MTALLKFIKREKSKCELRLRHALERPSTTETELQNLKNKVAYYEQIFDIVSKYATGSFVDVINCKQCTSFHRPVLGCSNEVGICNTGKYLQNANGYCNYAERKE